MARSLLLTTVACRWFGKAPFVKNCMAWALTCPKTVQQRPWVTREIETRLPDSTVSYSGVVDHRSRRSVFSLLRSCVDRCHVWPNWALGGNPRRWMFKHISLHKQLGQFDVLQWSEASCRVLLCGKVKVEPHYRGPEAMRLEWNTGSLKSDAWNCEVEYLWNWCSWILPTLGSSILQLSSKEPELTYRECLHRHHTTCLQVSLSGYYGSLAWQQCVSSVPCMRFDLKWDQDKLHVGQLESIGGYPLSLWHMVSATWDMQSPSGHYWRLTSTSLYCLVAEASVCDVNNLPEIVTQSRFAGCHKFDVYH